MAILTSIRLQDDASREVSRFRVASKIQGKVDMLKVHNQVGRLKMEETIKSYPSPHRYPADTPYRAFAMLFFFATMLPLVAATAISSWGKRGSPPEGYSRVENFCEAPNTLECCDKFLGGVGGLPLGTCIGGWYNSCPVAALSPDM
jgi:hypothetical protein